MNNEEAKKLTEKYMMNTYTRFPIAFEKGEGSYLFDVEGKKYLDFVTGIAVCNLGHSHKKVIEVIKSQAEKLIHTSNLFHIPNQGELAKVLCENSFADKCFFSNSGSEANEGAIKLARKYFHEKGENRFHIVSMEKSFHGRTLAAMAATGQEKVREGFDPILEKFTYVPFNDLENVKKAIQKETAAILVEPIQGEGGVNMPDVGFLEGLRKICDDNNVLLIFDEIQVGMGRTGKMFAYEHFGIEPDIMTLAKGLANGIPIGALLTTDEVAKGFTPGTHGSTFGGNPFATAVAKEVIEIILNDNVLDNTVNMGNYLLDQLVALKKDCPVIESVRGMGLIIGVNLKVESKPYVNKALEKGLIINSTGGTVLRFLPPLTVKENEIDEAVEILREILK